MIGHNNTVFKQTDVLPAREFQIPKGADTVNDFRQEGDPAVQQNPPAVGEYGNDP